MNIIEETFQPEFKILENNLELSHHLLESKLASGSISDNNEYNLPMMIIYWKVLKLYKGMIVLCKEGFGEEASVLLRSIIEMVINYFYLVEDPVKRGLQYRRYYHVSLRESIIKARKYAQECVPKDIDLCQEEFVHDEAIKELDEKISKIDSSYDRIKQQKEFDARGLWSGKPLAEMVNELDHIVFMSMIVKA